ncbi:YgjV family protein [Kingella kingae]|uniref:Uroporphyrinogen decarboxylase n=2 Tax=Kingella kingae TaxID=504 RepID=F5S7N4_KINKI|nr:YgjV family protein [Kingella kingae]EGK08888.1 hypothetical protein HMPREF0476_1217 [Kingella kingae ATCC 23330]EIC14619.1 hypothetical protein KKB_00125 [Kingella kingae PYKK081]MBD3614530.1 YgjV family protein [Kingella kingae]MBD3632863.1 YgjV family protein [Kingella kingae]MBD3660172.1 YgjV family protein [Kingella kingae]
MNWTEVLGYVAMVIVATSFLLKDMLTLRIVNAVGCLCFVVYGFMTGAMPVVGLNLLVSGINIYHAYNILRAKK